jgi:hypothetical protein
MRHLLTALFLTICAHAGAQFDRFSFRHNYAFIEDGPTLTPLKGTYRVEYIGRGQYWTVTDPRWTVHHPGQPRSLTPCIKVNGAPLMVVEMGILLLAPKDGGLILFSLCLLYDPSWLNALLPENLRVPVDFARRLPVAMVLLQAIACLLICLRFDESRPRAAQSGACRKALDLTLRTARMAFTTRSIAMVLAGGFLIDAVARNFATLVSEFYRLIGIPGWAFGLIGSLIAVGNWFIPTIAAWVNRRHETLPALVIGGAVASAGLWLLTPAWPWLGLLPAALLMMTLGYVGFTVSRHLHAVASANHRATLLSVKGLVFNLAYGSYSLVFSLALAATGKSGADALHHVLIWQAILFTIVIAAFGMAALPKAMPGRRG